jgi:hypothetical protein
VDTARFHTQEGWLEQGLWAPEPLIANGDDLSVRQRCPSPAQSQGPHSRASP